MKPAEIEFLNAAAIKVAAGMSIDDAMQAVIDDQERAWLKFLAMRPDEKAAFAGHMAAIVRRAILAKEPANG